MNISSGLVVATLVLSSSVVHADDVYKSVMPDGSVVYGESPMAGARKVGKIDSRAAISGATIATREDKQRVRDLNMSASSAVGVIPQAARPPAPPLQQGAISDPGLMPKRGY